MGADHIRHQVPQPGQLLVSVRTLQAGDLDNTFGEERMSNKQTPLEEEWIAYCWRKSLIGTRISYVEYLALVREIERAHGIKENT
jgi:hypothetical protein